MINSVESHSPSNQSKKIATSRFGEIEIDDEKLITMTSPFLGFPDQRLFVLLPHSPNAPFFWLQSTETPDLAFIVIAPEYLTDQYKPEMSATVRKELKISREKELELMVILTIPPGKPKEMTANLLGPIAFNPSQGLAKQVVLDPKVYDPCWPIQVA